MRDKKEILQSKFHFRMDTREKGDKKFFYEENDVLEAMTELEKELKEACFEAKHGEKISDFLLSAAVKQKEELLDTLDKIIILKEKALNTEQLLPVLRAIDQAKDVVVKYKQNG